jgi:hypothetical protein
MKKLLTNFLKHMVSERVVMNTVSLLGGAAMTGLLLIFLVKVFGALTFMILAAVAAVWAAVASLDEDSPL